VSQKIFRAIGLALALIVTGVAGVWAGQTIFSPPPDVLAAPNYVLATAESGTVGQTWRLNASAEWPVLATLPGASTGIVTTVDFDNTTEAQPGDVLFSVDMRPVVVAQGDIPAYRDLAPRSEGPDVAQLQQMLAHRGFYPGAISGVFGSATTQAVRAWQRSLGLTASGTVSGSDIVFVPQLPARLALTPEVTVGARVTDGFESVEVLAENPVFTISITEMQGAAMPPGTQVDIEHADGIWPAEVQSIQFSAAAGSPVAILKGASGGVICGTECGQVAVAGDSTFPAVVHVVPTASGIVVPAAAVVTNAQGDTGVLLEDGTFTPVNLVASASGRAAVAGITAGTKVRTPGSIG